MHILSQVLCLLSQAFCSQNVAAEKCKEYGKAVYVEIERPILSLALTVSDANEKIADCSISHTPLIVGGTKAEPKEFPHMALIGFAPSNNSTIISWVCGGSLISERHLLTAAHCETSGEHPAQFARLGLSNTIDPGYHMQQKSIIERITHPRYKRPEKYHDIAIFVLDSAVTFSPYVRPACLNTEMEQLETSAIACGFGKTQYHHVSGSTVLRKVQLSLISNKQCFKTYKHDVRRLPQGLTDSTLCAGHLAGGKDTCQGDSGGPLQIVLSTPYCMYSIIGVTSFGKFCGFAKSPAVYTNVAYYIPWIEQIVWG